MGAENPPSTLPTGGAPTSNTAAVPPSSPSLAPSPFVSDVDVAQGIPAASPQQQQQQYQQPPTGGYATAAPYPPQQTVFVVPASIPGCRVLPPRVPPVPGQQIIGWEGEKTVSSFFLAFFLVDHIASAAWKLMNVYYYYFSTAAVVVIQPAVGCCQCDTLSLAGWVAVILLVLLFWPAAFIPCLIDICHDQQCVPVYGWPGQQQQQQPQQPQQQQQQPPMGPPPTYA